MKQTHYARKRRQLKAAAAKLNSLLEKGDQRHQNLVAQLLLKVRALARELRKVVSRRELGKVLGAAAMLLGLGFTQQAEAQITFAPPVQNPFGVGTLQYYAFPAFADLDGDGDIDMIAGTYYGGLAYYENTGTDTTPQLTGPSMNPFGLDSTYYFAFPAFADMDGDGDMDLLVGEAYGNLQYFQNTGTATSPAFASPVQNPFGITSTYYLFCPSVADLDGDGDMDLMVGESYGALQYFENTGSSTSPQFAAPSNNPFGLDSVYVNSFPSFADLDKDGDMDLFVGEYYGAIQYFQNIGSTTVPSFMPPVANPFGIDSTYALAAPAFADLDGDGDMDLMVGEYYGNLQYFENTTPIPIGIGEEKPAFGLRMYPNPATETVFLKSRETLESVEIMDLQGRTLLRAHDYMRGIQVGALPKGVYLLKATNRQGEAVIRKLNLE